MKRVKNIEIDKRQITISELTVEEVVNLLDDLGGSLTAVMFDGRIPLSVVAKSSGLEVKEFNKWLPSDLDILISEVETVNPHSARLCKKLVELSERVRAKVQPPQKSAPSARK